MTALMAQANPSPVLLCAGATYYLLCPNLRAASFKGRSPQKYVFAVWSCGLDRLCGRQHLGWPGQD